MALDRLPGLDAPQALSVGPTRLGLFWLNLLTQSRAQLCLWLGAFPLRCPGCSGLLSTAGACASTASPARAARFHKTQIFALFFFRPGWKFSHWTFDIAQNTLNLKYRNISMSLYLFLPVLGTQLLEGGAVPLCSVSCCQPTPLHLCHYTVRRVYSLAQSLCLCSSLSCFLHHLSSWPTLSSWI